MSAGGRCSFLLQAMALVVAASVAVAAEDWVEMPALLRSAGTMADAAVAAGSSVVRGRDDWLFFAPELRHLAAGRFWSDAAHAPVPPTSATRRMDPLGAILDFKSQLDRAGIELIVMPVPPKAVVYPEFLFPVGRLPPEAAARRIDRFHEEFYARLGERGVHVLDLTPVFLARKGEHQLYCRQDTHWSGDACVLAAAAVARELRSRGWFAAVPKQKFDENRESIELTGDLWRELGGEPPAKETIDLRFVGVRDGSGLKPVQPNPASPVILLGDSHCLVFHAGDDMHATGAGLADQLALELGFAVDLVAVRGSGATPARVNLMRRARNPDYLPAKRVVVWCFAAREFTESSGWAAVPIVP